MRKEQIAQITFLILLICQSQAWAEIDWRIGGAVSESYDDNVTYTKDDTLDDMITKVSLNGGFKQEGYDEEVEFKTELTQSIFAKNTDFNNLAADLSLKGFADFKEFHHFKFNEVFRSAEDPKSFEEAFGGASGRYRYYRNRYDLEYAKEWGPQWTTKLQYLQNNNLYNRDDLTDVAQYSPGFETEFAFSSADQIMAGYDFSYFDFDEDGNSKINTVSAGYRHYFTPKWYTELRPGYNFIEAFNGETLAKPRYEASLINLPDENTQFNLTYLKEHGVSYFSPEVFDNWRVSLWAFRQMTSRIIANIGAFYGEGRYTTSGIADKLNGGSLGLEYALSEKASITTSYVYQKTDSNLDTRTYTKNTFFLGFKVTF